MKSVDSVFTMCCLVLVTSFGVSACSSDSSNPAGVDGGGTPGADGGGTVLDAGGADGPAAEVDCSKVVDGTLCATDGVCVSGVCATSRCGDTYIDSRAGEECEDKNDNTGDGCTQCRFDCKASTTCDDGNACNGAESCSVATHMCEPGTLAGAVSCLTPAGTQGECKMGTCVRPGCGNGTIDPGEDCDDKVVTAGCTNECKFTCTRNEDCDNKNACDGVETCDIPTHSCKPGTAVVCNANGCTGMCDPGAGTCTYADADKDGSRCNLDCNDADPATFPGGFECKDGKDNDCSVATVDGTAPGCECYVDSDRDGFAADANGAIASPGICQAGYTRTKPIDVNTIDCGPGNASAFPGQSLYFPTAYCPAKICLVGQGTFDYNCNKGEESTLSDNKTAAAVCAKAESSFACSFSSGWVGAAVPACGKPGTYRSCTWGRLGGCTGIDTPNRVRPCH
jgi:hypothetical protein